MDTTPAEAAQVVALLESGLNQSEVARQLNLSRYSVRRVYQRYQETGGYARHVEQDLTAHRPANGPKLTKAHKQAGLQFARSHLNWTYEQWSSVMFTDECRMTFHGHDGRARVYRRSSERFAQCCMSERVAYGRGSCMFWGGIN